MVLVAQPDPAETLRAYVTIQQAADKEILRALRDAYKDVNAQLARMSRAGASDLDRARALAIKQSILLAQADLFERTGQTIQRRRVQAAARAIQVAGRYDEAAFAAVGRERDARAVAEGLEETEARAIDAVEARLGGASRIPLSERVYRTRDWSSGVLERRINSALARGLNAQEFAREIQPLVNPNTPGGPRYAALRLARTEINNAYHAMAVRAAQLKPWIDKVEWHTSKSHVRKDICDQLNGQFFKPTEVPLKPHPQCLCYITPVVDEDDDAFLDALTDGDFDDFIDSFAAQQGIDLPPAAAVDSAPPGGTVTPELPKPEPVLRTGPGGFRVGNWTRANRDVLVEAEMDMLRRYRKYSPQLSDEEFEAKIRNDAEEIVPFGATRYTNGSATIDFNYPLREVTINSLLRQFERLQTTNGIDEMKLIVSDLRDVTLGGQAAPRGGKAIVLNALWEDKAQPSEGDNWNMPAAKFTSPLVYSLTHEWGHILTHEEEDVIAGLVRQEDLSGYGRTRPDEAIAELFAEWFLHSGQPDYRNPTADLLAERYGWTRP